MTERVGAIVLAGGRSSRFGRDKLAEPIDGRPMLDLTIDAVRAIASDIVIAAGPESTPSVPGGVEVTHDEIPFQGPLTGLAAGLRSLDPALERVIVVGGDMPTLVPTVLRRLLRDLDTHEAAVLADDAGPRPLPMAVRRSVAAPAVDRLVAVGERRLRALLTELDVSVVPPSAWGADDPDAATLRDVDTPADLPPSQARAAVVARIAASILALPAGRRGLVAIDGVDGAGKTVFADELAAAVRPRRPIVRATVDRFHRPAAGRYVRGRESPEGFYRDSYDLDALIGRLLDPFSAGRTVVTGVFDHVSDRSDVAPAIDPPPDAILILDGIFLHRPELAGRWDMSVFLDVDFAVSIPRGAERGDGDPDPSAASNRRYVEGQRLYLAEADPKALATYVVDNTDLASPRVIRARDTGP